MKEQTIFPREEHADVLFQKILADPWACDKLFAMIYSVMMNWRIPFLPMNSVKHCFALTATGIYPLFLWQSAKIPFLI